MTEATQAAEAYINATNKYIATLETELAAARKRIRELEGESLALTPEESHADA